MQIQAVEILRRHEEQLLGKVKDMDLPQEPRQGRWSRPSIKMLRMSVDQLTAKIEEESKILWVEQTGELIDRDHLKLVDEARAQ